MKAQPKLILWWFENIPPVNKNGQFKNPPRLIRVFDNETCKFFKSPSPHLYIDEFDKLFKEGANGNLVELRNKLANLQ